MIMEFLFTVLCYFMLTLQGFIEGILILTDNIATDIYENTLVD